MLLQDKPKEEIIKEFVELQQVHRQIIRLQSLSNKIVNIISSDLNLKDVITDIIKLIQQETKFSAVGIRLKNGDDYPYFGQNGFSENFLLTENFLSVKDKNSLLCRDKDGNPILKCTCDLVVSGKTDKRNSLFTEGGSAWTNNFMTLSKLSNIQDSELFPRNKCINYGFGSFALIPIRTNENIIGILQLNEKKKNAFTHDMIVVFESICTIIGTALMHKKAEETLSNERTLLRTIIDLMPDAIYVKDVEGRKILANVKEVQFLGMKSECEVLGKTDFDLYPLNVAESSYNEEQSIIRTGKSILHVEGIITNKDGQNRYLLGSKVPLKNAQGQITGIIGLNHDITERKQAEEALQNSEERFKQLAEVFPEIIFECDLHGNATYSNENGFKKLGYSLDDFAKGINIIDLIVPEDRERVMAQILKRINDATSGFTEYKPLCKDGSSFDAIAFAAPIFQNQEVVGLRGFILDITDRKQSEEKLKESEQRYRILFETSPTGNLLIDEAGIILEANEVISKTTLYSHEELIGSNVRMFVLPEQSHQVDENIKRILAGETREHEVINRRKDGTSCIFLLKETSVMLPNRKLGILSVSIDITERKRVENKLKKNEEKLRISSLYTRSLIEASLDPLVTISASGKITDVNIATENITGLSREKLIGTDFSDYFSEPEKARLGYQDVFKNGFVIDYPLTICHANGKLVEVLYNASVYYDDKGKIIGVFAAARDISRLKQAEKEIKLKNEELRKINAEKDKFFSIIAHDLRSPFTVIVGFSEILAEKIKEKNFNSIEKYSENIKQSANRAMKLLNNLMEWSRSQTGRMNFNPEHFEITNLINEIVRLFADAANQKSITIIKDLHIYRPIYADKSMISTILRNLISNALKFTPKNGMVTISTKRLENNMIEIAIRDTGIGLAPEMIENLFRLDVNTGRPGTDGEISSGLGLHLCNELIKKHEGTIWVESEEGKGSTFYVTIPNNA